VNRENNTREPLASKSNLKAAARYAMLPGIIPRIRALGFHFGHFAYLMALILQSARLIPAGHPVLQPQNMGQYSVRSVLALAANNLRWSWKHIDQIAIFAAIMIGIILIVIQAALIAFYAMVGTAHASSGTSFFETPSENVQTDVVLIFLEQVFGANLNVFGAATQPVGTPVYLGIQKVLGFYSMATMVIAVIIVLYYLITVVGEAAKTGTPFGQRFNSLWAPIRLIVALGLLVPLGTGLNSAQYVTLWTAKMGSGLATQMWSVFAGEMTAATDIVSKPPVDSTTALVRRVFLSEVCAAGYNRIQYDSPNQVKILQNLGNTSIPANLSNPQSMVEAAKNADMAFVDISWSRQQPGERANDYTCGHITVSLSEFDFYREEGGWIETNGIVNQDESVVSSWWNWLWGGRQLTDKIGQIQSSIREQYIREIGRISEDVKPAADALAEYYISVNPGAGLGREATLDSAGIPGILSSAANSTYKNINTTIQSTYEDITGSDYARSGAYEEMIKQGWGTAGLWYGNIAKINQKYMDAINTSAPTLGTVFSAPDITSPGRAKNGGAGGFFSSIFGAARDGVTGTSQSELDAALLRAQIDYADVIKIDVPKDSRLYRDAKLENAHDSGKSGFAFALSWMIGGSELYDLKNNPTLDPMARVAGAGHAMMNRTLVMFTIGSVAAVSSVAGSTGGSMIASKGAVIPGAIIKTVSELVGAIAGLFFILAGIGLVAGIFLAYIIPLMPFVYFAFAVIGWVLEIFEAIVAMPLWALAHLRIDGDGMPGQGAIGGYQLLLMILLRPALIILGLIGGYVIFGAAMYFFSSLFNSATTITQQEIANNSVGALGIFIYVIVFAFLTYNIAIMCFKMIDDVPKGMLRWIGANVGTFNDSRNDPINGSREMLAGMVVGASSLGGGIRSTRSGIQTARNNHAERMDKIKNQQNKPEGGAFNAPQTGGTSSQGVNYSWGGGQNKPFDLKNQVQPQKPEPPKNTKKDEKDT
jgi:conjugal transfer/type IV secretion protein DotA/TraY